jgi:hypothetical protein
MIDEKANTLKWVMEMIDQNIRSLKW